MRNSFRTIRFTAWLSALLLAGSWAGRSVFSQASAPAKSINNTTTSQPAGNRISIDWSQSYNPHGYVSDCRYCHETQDKTYQHIAVTDDDTVCLKCHNGKDAKAESHPVGRTFAGKQVVQPEGWPVPNGKLGCITCHETQLCSKDNPAFVRGYKKGEILEFCSRCHLPMKEHERYNPHVMLNRNNKPDSGKCLFCHRSSFDGQEHTDRTGRPELRGDGITLCLSCHPRHLDIFEPGHIGHKVSAKMKAYMIAFDQTPSGQKVATKKIKQALQDKTGYLKRLPLAGNNIIVCSTCHNPHQQGLFPNGSVLASGAIPAGQKPIRSRLRGLGQEVCRACHNK